MAKRYVIHKTGSTQHITMVPKEAQAMSTGNNNNTTLPPFYGQYTGQPALAGTSS